MNPNSTSSSSKKTTDTGRQRRFDWVFEMAVFMVVTPALVRGVMALNDLPIV